MIHRRSLTVLIHEWVTGGGLSEWPLPPSWAAEGRAMRRALAADFAAAEADMRVIVTLDARLPEDAGPWTIERIAPGRAEQRLPELARAVDLTLVIAPETTRILARLATGVLSTGACLLGSLPPAVDLTGDKERLCRWLEARGMATPPSRVVEPSRRLPPDTRFPAVLKPVDGAGSIDTFYFEDERGLPEAARALPRALLQPYLPGMPLSASFLVDVHGRAWLVGVGGQEIRVHDGRISYNGGRLPVPYRAAGLGLRTVVEAIPGLRGFVGVDFLWDEVSRRATVIEINPRPTTSCVGLTRLLAPGQLADAWLGAFEHPRGNAGLLRGLAYRVHASRPLTFDAAGP